MRGGTDGKNTLKMSINTLHGPASPVLREDNIALRLTISIGVISRVPDGELTREALLKLADE